MTQIIGEFQTENGAKYITQLCKHFSHKVETEVDGNTGWAKLPTGLATMEAAAQKLTITLDVIDPTKADLAKHIIDSHLVTFAFREKFENMMWQAES